MSTDAPTPPLDSAEPVISVRGLTKAFGELEVLRGVDLDVQQAENVVVLGRSGTGKSVLIKILVRLLTPDAGDVLVLGQRVHSLARPELDALRRRVGFSFQNSALYDSMNVAQNLSFPLTMNEKSLSAAEVKERVLEALEEVGLADTLDQMPSELSGGQRKRIGIARTLILRPEIMLYDEPTAGLDPVTCGEINDLILEVQEVHGTASIIITHDLTCARSTGGRVAMLLEGQIAHMGSFDEVFASDDPRLRQFYDYNFTTGRALMSPPPRRQTAIVGLFIAFALAILAGGILMIGSLNDTFTKKITVTAVFPGVNGLARGDNIWFSGVKVGIVTRLRFQGDSQVEVEMRIDEEVTRYIHSDALAKISSDGLIGNKIVVVYGGTEGTPSLQDGSVLSIGEAVSTEEIMATFQANNVNLLAVTTDLKGITGELAAGRGNIGRLLKEDALYEGATATVSNLQAASQDAQAVTTSLAAFSADLNRPGSLPKALITDTTTHGKITASVDQLQAASTDAAQLMEGLSDASADPGTPVGTMLHDREAGTDLKGTLANLNLSTALLAEDLEAVQHNFLFRRYFKKKDKAEEKARAEAASGSDGTP